MFLQSIASKVAYSNHAFFVVLLRRIHRVEFRLCFLPMSEDKCFRDVVYLYKAFNDKYRRTFKTFTLYMDEFTCL